MQYYRINHSEPTKQEITHFSFSSTDGAPVLRIVFKTSGAKVESILTDNTEITSLEILIDDSVIYSTSDWVVSKNIYITYDPNTNFFEVQKTFTHN